MSYKAMKREISGSQNLVFRPRKVGLKKYKSYDPTTPNKNIKTVSLKKYKSKVIHIFKHFLIMCYVLYF